MHNERERKSHIEKERSVRLSPSLSLFLCGARQREEDTHTSIHNERERKRQIEKERSVCLSPSLSLSLCVSIERNTKREICVSLSVSLSLSLSLSLSSLYL